MLRQQISNTRKVSIDLALSPHLYALVIEDEVMEPLFEKDTILIIDGNKKPKDQSYIIAKSHKNKHAIFRQLLIDGEFKYLKPLNPNTKKHKMKLLDKKKEKFCGSLVQARKNYIG